MTKKISNGNNRIIPVILSNNFFYIEFFCWTLPWFAIHFCLFVFLFLYFYTNANRQTEKFPFVSHIHAQTHPTTLHTQIQNILIVPELNISAAALFVQIYPSQYRIFCRQKLFSFFFVRIFMVWCGWNILTIQ